MINNLNKKGVALVMVLLIATIVLSVTTTMLYLLNQSSSYSGLSKRYANSMEAAMASSAVISDFISYRADPALLAALQGISFQNTISDKCASDKFHEFTGDWDPSCDDQMYIDPADPNYPYDYSFKLGAYEVFSKIVHTIPGNTSTSSDARELKSPCVVHCDGSSITTTTIATSYIVEVLAKRRGGSSNKKMESARISILYQY